MSLRSLLCRIGGHRWEDRRPPYHDPSLCHDCGIPRPYGRRHPAAGTSLWRSRYYPVRPSPFQPPRSSSLSDRLSRPAIERAGRSEAARRGTAVTGAAVRWDTHPDSTPPFDATFSRIVVTTPASARQDGASS